jgi:glycerophosphoryl diester phosphodiesterase
VHCNLLSAHTASWPLTFTSAGYSILLWTVNEPEIARRMLALGADCLVTDALDRIGPDFK